MARVSGAAAGAAAAERATRRSARAGSANPSCWATPLRRLPSMRVAVRGSGASSNSSRLIRTLDAPAPGGATVRSAPGSQGYRATCFGGELGMIARPTREDPVASSDQSTRHRPARGPDFTAGNADLRIEPLRDARPHIGAPPGRTVRRSHDASSAFDRRVMSIRRVGSGASKLVRRSLCCSTPVASRLCAMPAMRFLPGDLQRAGVAVYPVSKQVSPLARGLWLRHTE